MKPTIFFHYFESDLWFAVLTDEGDCRMAATLHSRHGSSFTPEENDWYEGVDMLLTGPTSDRGRQQYLHPLPDGANIAVIHGY